MFGCILERYIRQRVEIDEMQSRLMSGHGGTTVAVFILSQLQKLLLASSQRRIFIESTHYDETKKIAHDSQIVRNKENLKLSNPFHATCIAFRKSR